MFRRQTTLEQYCKPENCKLFYTKGDSTPIEFLGMFQAAMTFRETRLCELDSERGYLEATLPYWAVESYKAAERAFRLVESEHSDPNNKPNTDIQIRPTGSKVFAEIESAVAARSMYGDGCDLEDIEKVFDAKPDLSQSICEYFVGTNE